MLYLSAQQVQRHLTLKIAFDAVAEALICVARGSARINPVVMGQGLNEGEVFSIKSAVVDNGPIVGLKVGSYWPGNAAKGLPRHASSVFLLDHATGRLAAVVEASELNGPRTAAADAVAASILARKEARTLAVLGAGHQAAHEVRALCAVRPIERVLVASRTLSSASRLQETLEHELSAAVEVTTVEEACRRADILVTVTPARAALFEADWVRPGTHIATMGSDQVGKQELPPALVRRARLFCDLPRQSVSIGEFQHVRDDVESGSLRLTALGDVLIGRCLGRETDTEITIFDSSGLAAQDLLLSARIVQMSQVVHLEPVDPAAPSNVRGHR
jgi:ornithine cyclodeaminase/alanine dehydrogenase-like protein (mu-crystallin family)